MQTTTSSDGALMVSALAATLEKAMNKALNYDPATQQALARFDNKRLAVKMTQPTLALCFTFTPQGINVNAIHADETHNPTNSPTNSPTNNTADYDAVVTGSARDFIQAANQSQSSMADSGITISGNVAFLSQVQGIAKTIDIDWEDAITQAIGPVAGHGLASAISTAVAASKRNSAFVRNNLHSVLRDELLLVPAQEEINAFCDDVDHIKEQADRLEAKLHAFLHAQK